ncbi:hypothetical protein PR048_002991 [Dryococelus australis]|uniref:Uncharacterized protein n=1 Tax=Dryococelus australis TaxID=614101 RepID=A0ABQ9ILU4_9NEOP|nr:hypothetical protein PR048_002991 [Dryococelus australis]
MCYGHSWCQIFWLLCAYLAICAKDGRIVGHFKHSVQATQQLNDCQRTLKLPEHRLIQDEPTRWDSTYQMLSRLLEQRKAARVEKIAGTSAAEEVTASEPLLQIHENIFVYWKNSKYESKEGGDQIPVCPSRVSLFRVTFQYCRTDKYKTEK